MVNKIVEDLRKDHEAFEAAESSRRIALEELKNLQTKVIRVQVACARILFQHGLEDNLVGSYSIHPLLTNYNMPSLLDFMPLAPERKAAHLLSMRSGERLIHEALATPLDISELSADDDVNPLKLQVHRFRKPVNQYGVPSLKSAVYVAEVMMPAENFNSSRNIAVRYSFAKNTDGYRQQPWDLENINLSSHRAKEVIQTLDDHVTEFGEILANIDQAATP
ncbi:MAG: hypothetical protein JWS12_861 [Candidatus Saccharibacteria bacterium]|nr:hypothetical protein [Candidatus Saccharibacteria bacterium]